MSVDMIDLGMDDFVDGIIEIVTAGDFMDMNEGAQIVLSESESDARRMCKDSEYS